MTLNALWRLCADRGFFARMTIGPASSQIENISLLVDAIYSQAHRPATGMAKKMWAPSSILIGSVAQIA